MNRPPASTVAPSAARRTRSGATDLRIRHELLDIVARSGILAGWATICVAGFATLLSNGLDAPARLLAWTIGMTVVSAGRIALCSAWLRSRSADEPREMPQATVMREDAMRIVRWERTQTAVALVSGLAWASLGFFVVGDADRSTMLVGFTLAIALVMAGGFSTADRISDALFGLPIVVAQTINLLRFPAEHGVALAVAWLAMVAVLYLLPRASASSLRHGLTERIEYERRAHEQTALLDTAPLGILVVRDSTIVVCNDALLQLLGYARKEELIGRNVRAVIPDDESWRELIEDASAALHGRVAPRIVRRRRKDGSVIDVLRNVAAVHGNSGDTEFIGLYEDVQDRVAIEEGYRHAVQMQRLVFESAGEGIAIVSDGVIEQGNQALSDLVGLPVAQLEGRPLHAIFEDPQGWAEIEKRFERLGNSLKLERRVVRSDGRSIWVNVTGRLVESAPQAVDGTTMPTPGRRSIWILADLSVQKKKEAENWHHANHDVMTGLPNRRFLQDRLDQALAFARRDGRRVAVFELDLDGFKSVNDRDGHRFGDAVLEEVARRLSTVVRELDTVGRWGGDEFVLVLKEIDSREVVEETVRRVIARLSDPIVYLGRNLSVGASIGIALFPDHGDEVEALMLAADLAMYESKSRGGNTWTFASAPAQAPRGKYRPAAEPPGVTDVDDAVAGR